MYLCVPPKPNSGVAASQARQEALYFRETHKDFVYQQQPENATEIYQNNLACVAMSQKPVRRIFSCHIDIRRYFVRELVKAGFVKLIPLRKHKMVTNALTKSLPSPAFIGHRRVMMGQTPLAMRFLLFLYVLILSFNYFFVRDFSRFIFFWIARCTSIDHLLMREFVSGPPRYH